MELTQLTMKDLVDGLLVLLAIAVPVYLVARMGWLGILLGAMSNWLLINLDMSLSAQPALYDPFSLFGLHGWPTWGWLAGLAYGIGIYGLLRLHHTLHQRTPRVLGR